MEKKLVAGYDANMKVTNIFDLNKVSLVSKFGDTIIKIIIDGYMQNFEYPTISERDKTFDYFVKRMQEYNE